MAETIHCPVLIVGAGPAGYTAAIYAARANRSPIVLEGLQPGGQLTITTDVENYSGFSEPIQGPWLMEQMRHQAENVGAKLIGDLASEVDFSVRPFVCRTDSGDTYSSDSVIIATGAQARWLGLDGEKRLGGRGVSACATCDGFFYKNKSVAVVGGGNTAVEEALYLSNIASHVTLIHRRERLRSEQILQDRLFKKSNVNVLWNREVTDILGNDEENPKISRLVLRHTETAVEETLHVDGLFVAIGHRPNTEIFNGQIEIDADGYIKTDPGSTLTNVPGVFAAGDVRDKVYRQAITAAGMGCMAALDAERYLDESAI
jgi:thioredoxin reductase (NADPH)